MRKIGLLGLAVLAVIAAALIWHVPDRLDRLTEPVVSQLPPAAIAPPPPPPPPPAAQQGPATPELPALPSREVAQIPFHAVPENDEPPKPQPFQMHDSPGLAPSRQASRSGGPAASGPSPRQLAGRAEAIAADALRVDGREFRLFGVQPPGGNDRCDGTLCTERARAMLAGRLARSASCRFPAPSNSAAICLDGDGVDLGGLLVGEGLALADRSQSFDYVGAESIAKSQKRGLWQLR